MGKDGGAGGDVLIAANCGRKLQKTAAGKGLFGKARQEKFLEHLAATANVVASARAAGVAPTTVYRKRMNCEAFRASWGRALEQGYARLEAALIHQALKDAGRPRVRGDKAVAQQPIDVALAATLLKHHRDPAANVGRGTGPKRGKATREETDAAIMKQLSALNRRLGGEG